MKEILLERNAGQALVLSGGGARAAIRWCLRLCQALPNYRPQILTGVSAGQSMPPIWRHSGLMAGSVEALVGLWQQMRTDKGTANGLGPNDGSNGPLGFALCEWRPIGPKDIRGMVQNAPLRT